MNNLFWLGLMVLLLSPVHVFAGPDDYVCDTAIYGAEAVQVKPNVLIILDTSGSMNDSLTTTQCSETPVSGGYSSISDYVAISSEKFCGTYSAETGSWSTACLKNAVYVCTGNTSATVGTCTTGWTKLADDVNNWTTGCTGTTVADIKNKLKLYGSATAAYDVSACKNSKLTYNYFLGNYINWHNLTSAGTESNNALNCTQTDLGRKIDIAKNVVGNLIGSTVGVNFGLMVFNTSDQGGALVTSAVSGSGYTTTIKDMTDFHVGSVTNEEALKEVVNSVVAGRNTSTPLAETLYEAMLYFKGARSYFNSGTYGSPISASCQPNYVVLLTDGEPTQDHDSILSTAIGDYDRDGRDPGSYVVPGGTNPGGDYLEPVKNFV